MEYPARLSTNRSSPSAAALDADTLFSSTGASAAVLVASPDFDIDASHEDTCAEGLGTDATALSRGAMRDEPCKEADVLAMRLLTGRAEMVPDVELDEAIRWILDATPWGDGFREDCLRASCASLVTRTGVVERCLIVEGPLGV
jgi:hypothetical protein